MTRNFRDLATLTALVLSLGGACLGPPRSSSDDVGNIQAALQLSPGTTLDTVSYAIGGPGGFARSGNVDVSHSSTISFTVGGIPAGQGYNITISGTASDNATTCSGSAMFDITPRMTTALMVRIQCREPARTGSVQINGTVNVCPVVDGIGANPGEIIVGTSTALTGLAHDSDTRPAPLTYAWVASSGTLAGATTPAPSFTCTAAGVSTITLTVSDGDCGDTGTVTVICTPGTAPAPVIRINEIESNQGVPGDWVELYNAGTTVVHLGGWTFRDNDDTHNYVIPTGTSIAAGGTFVLEEAAFGFGLGAMESARLYDATTTLVDTHTWTAHATTTYGRCPNGSGAFATQATVTRGAANDCGGGQGGSSGAAGGGAAGAAGAAGAGGGAAGAGGAPAAPIVINEVESSGGVPGDWVELYNVGSVAVDIGGWMFRDANEMPFYTIPAGTSIAAGGYFTLEEAAFGFGLGAMESARIYNSSGTLVDSQSWTAHAATTYGRCPNGSGALVLQATVTKGAANDCGGGQGGLSGAGGGQGGLSGAGGGVAGMGGSVATLPWPGDDAVVTVDAMNQFTSNLSGLTYQAATATSPAVLWATLNSPSLLFRLVWDSTTSTWVNTPTDGWAAGKTLHYATGLGAPDSEGVTKAELTSSAVYVGSERDNLASAVSRLVVLRVDTDAAGIELTATNDWDITADLPAAGANLGIEAITWVPDTYLVGNGFIDESTGAAYNPASYAGHGTGLFFVGIEGTGNIYGYALDHVTGAFRRVATIASGNAGVMGLEFDRDVGNLWAYCDNTCGNRASVLRVGATGRFQIQRFYTRPSTLPDSNNEGIAIVPESECVSGRKTFFWSDDSNFGAHALRQGSIVCGPLP